MIEVLSEQFGQSLQLRALEILAVFPLHLIGDATGHLPGLDPWGHIVAMQMCRQFHIPQRGEHCGALGMADHFGTDEVSWADSEALEQGLDTPGDGIGHTSERQR